MQPLQDYPVKSTGRSGKFINGHQTFLVAYAGSFMDCFFDRQKHNDFRTDNELLGALHEEGVAKQIAIVPTKIVN